jgi:hypothetical protein
MDANRVQISDQLLNLSAEGEDFEQIWNTFSNFDLSQKKSLGFFAAQLHDLRAYPAPAYTYPYYATQWPLKLDWYWSLATIALSRRVESGSSVDERYSQFLLPLLDKFRPLCSMSARALWIGSVSKDSNARSMAVEVWVTLIAEDRSDVETLVSALDDVVKGGWVKFNRVGELMAEISRVSPQHAYLITSVLEGLLCRLDIPTKDIPKLLEPLNECCEQLGRCIGDSLKQKLVLVKSGAAKAIAKTLCERQNELTDCRRSAIASALAARIHRAMACSPDGDQKTREDAKHELV